MLKSNKLKRIIFISNADMQKHFDLIEKCMLLIIKHKTTK